MLVLIDRFLPTYEVREHHQVVVRVEADRAYQAVREVDFSRSFIIRLLFTLRGLPRRPLTLSNMMTVGFVILGEDPGSEIVLGVAGRFWRPRGDLRRVDSREFTSFSEPGYAKAAWNFRVEPDHGRQSTISTETRVITTDLASHRAFRRYWLVVGPFSALIRRRALAVIKRKAESSSE